MEQKTKSETNEIITKLVRLQADVSIIKEKIGFVDDRKLATEMEAWESASAEDSAGFFDKHDL